MALLITISLVVKLYFLRFALIPSYLTDVGNLVEAVIVGAVSHGALALGLCGVIAFAVRSPVGQRLAATLLHGLIVAFAYIDFLMVRYQGSHVSYVQVELLGEGISSFDTLASFCRRGDAWLLFDLPILLGVVAVKSWRGRAWLAPSYMPTAAMSVFAIWNVFHFTVVGLKQDRFFYWDTDKISLPHTSHKYTYPVRWLLNGLFYLNMPRDPYEYVSEPPPGLPVPSAVIGVTTPHILIIQVESLSGGAAEWNYASQPVMPYLRNLTAQGVYFPNTMAPKMTGGSFDADVGVLTGFHPPPTSHPYGYTFAHPPYFTHVMGDRGYSVVTFDAYFADFMRSEANHLKMGVDRFRSARERAWSTTLRTLGFAAQGDREFLAWVRDNLLAERRPQLFFVRTLSGHGPYLGRDEQEEVVRTIGAPFASADDSLVRGFAAILRYTDVALREMLEPLMPLLKDGCLLVVIYGDHGAGIEIREPMAGFSLAETAQKGVPLLFLGTGLAPQRFFDVVSLADIPVTLARLVGVPFGYGELGGRDILASRPLPPLVTPSLVVDGSVRRQPTSEELAVLRYGYGKLGAPK